MKLYLNPPSPYARQVVAMAHELGLAKRLEFVECDPWSDPHELIEATPLCKVPALVTPGGLLIVESMTICEFLMEEARKPLPGGTAHFEVLSRAALAHGMIDAAFVSVIERRRPEERQWPEWTDRQHRAVIRTVRKAALPPENRFDLGDITLACALAYMDFRLPELLWRTPRADLAAWLDGVSGRPSMIASRP